MISHAGFDILRRGAELTLLRADEQWNLRFVRLYMKSLFQWQRWVPPVLRRHVRPSSTVRGGDGPTKQVVLDSSDSDDDAVMQSLMTADAIELFGGVGNDWAMLALREHMGERCAFYFAFMQHYAGFLGPVRVFLATIIVVCALTCDCARPAGASVYNAVPDPTMAILGHVHAHTHLDWLLCAGHLGAAYDNPLAASQQRVESEVGLAGLPRSRVSHRSPATLRVSFVLVTPDAAAVAETRTKRRSSSVWLSTTARVR